MSPKTIFTSYIIHKSQHKFYYNWSAICIHTIESNFPSIPLKITIDSVTCTSDNVFIKPHCFFSLWRTNCATLTNESLYTNIFFTPITLQTMILWINVPMCNPSRVTAHNFFNAIVIFIAIVITLGLACIFFVGVQGLVDFEAQRLIIGDLHTITYLHDISIRSRSDLNSRSAFYGWRVTDTFL